ncbi:MAG: MgtC/SapB family protein [Candidatus Competibacteraceae bacterium]|nr:MgtC/SapB family protein [Candidatus Competibacteraceae bacterium]
MEAQVGNLWSDFSQWLLSLNDNIQFQILYEVALAMFLGGLIGVEREIADKPAGFRTHMLIAGSAALLVGLGDALLDSFMHSMPPGQGGNQPPGTGIRSDPIRIVEAIVTGISFLGAGTIIRRGAGERVQGLTTASSILMSASIGICVALGQFWLAIGVTALALMVLRGLKFVERWLDRQRPQARRERRQQQDQKLP